MKYFYKELPEQVYAPNGRGIECDFVDPDGFGWIATDNGYVINQIEAAIRARIGGFVASDKAGYDAALKKKETEPARPSKKNHGFQPFHLHRPNGAAGFAGQGVKQPAPKPEPLAVPTAQQMQPRTGRVKPPPRV